jgi:hypothetical protein
MQRDITTVVEQTLQEFCLNFLTDPYLCYTEHGLHALFFVQLYNALLPGERFVLWRGHKVCVLQKEYPTAGLLGKPKRQHWDIAVLKNPPECWPGKERSYDYLRLAAVIEFGLNEAEEHLEDDIARLSHSGANVDKGYFVHLYRLTAPNAKCSGRDWSNASAQICPKERVAALLAHRPIAGYYGIYDAGGRYPTGLWSVTDGNVTAIQPTVPADLQHFES